LAYRLQWADTRGACRGNRAGDHRDAAEDQGRECQTDGMDVRDVNQRRQDASDRQAGERANAQAARREQQCLPENQEREPAGGRADGTSHFLQLDDQGDGGGQAGPVL
jgi:hypothetical protein